MTQEYSSGWLHALELPLDLEVKTPAAESSSTFRETLRLHRIDNFHRNASNTQLDASKTI